MLDGLINKREVCSLILQRHTQEYNYFDFTQYIPNVIMMTINTSSFKFKSLLFMWPLEMCHISRQPIQIPTEIVRNSNL